MTDEERTTPEEQPVTGEVPAAGPAELREAYNREKARNKALTDEVMGIRLGEIGLNSQVGLGKAIAKEYDGDLTVEAISEYARDEYGHTGQVTADPTLAAAQRTDQVMGMGEPIPPAPPAEQQHMEALREAAEGGDVKASIAYKLSQQQQE